MYTNQNNNHMHVFLFHHLPYLYDCDAIQFIKWFYFCPINLYHFVYIPWIVLHLYILKGIIRQRIDEMFRSNLV